MRFSSLQRALMNEVFALVAFLLLVGLLVSRIAKEQAIPEAARSVASGPTTGETAASSQAFQR